MIVLDDKTGNMSLQNLRPSQSEVAINQRANDNDTKSNGHLYCFEVIDHQRATPSISKNIEHHTQIQQLSTSQSSK